MPRPTPEQLARFRARVTRDLTYYRACLARLDDHTPLHVTVGVLIAKLQILDGYLASAPPMFTREELAAMGGDTTEWKVARDRGGRRLRGVNDPANDRKL